MTIGAWRQVDDDTGADIQRSARTFNTLLECVEDAKRHGYVAPRQCEPSAFSTTPSATFITKRTSLRVNAERVLVSGYEMSTKRVRWRDVDLSTIESARPTEYTLAR